MKPAANLPIRFRQRRQFAVPIDDNESYVRRRHATKEVIALWPFMNKRARRMEFQPLV